ncbi:MULTISPECIES: hypothetical protein [unclassified Acinetobacter]|uniref:hypothetical protein n=1 Tax=unclassified Acinetobacter TaxID=196816 RepID=UPI0015D3040F|nr:MULTISPECIES: hypothetical protein [unclassified Acinetobacter]
MINEKKHAYIWTREHSPERLFNLEKIRSSWSILFGEKKVGHFQPIQYLPNPTAKNSNHFDIVIEGDKTKVYLRVFTTKEWFIREVYNKATELTRIRYPDYDAHHFIDGDRVGERRIVFHSERHGLSRNHLRYALFDITEKSKPEITVTEFCRKTVRASTSTSKSQMDYIVVLDVDEINHEIVYKVEEWIKNNNFPTLSEKPLNFSWDEIKSYFTELSEPELVYLNWAEAEHSLSVHDKALFKAVNQLDITMVNQALNDGANLNRFCSEQSILSCLISAWNDYITFPDHHNTNSISLSHVKEMMQLLLDKGVHPDLHHPDGANALTDTVLAQQPELAEILLEYGADSSISLYTDMGMAPEPSAWSFAQIDGFNIDVELGAREVFYAMVRHRSTPAFTQEVEDRDRRDSMLSDEERSWWKA